VGRKESARRGGAQVRLHGCEHEERSKGKDAAVGAVATESAVAVTSPCSIVRDGRVSITALRECHTEMVETNVTFDVMGT